MSISEAQKMVGLWYNASNPDTNPKASDKFAIKVNDRVRIEAYLYHSSHRRYVFPDGSVAVMSKGKLSVARHRA